MSLLPLKTTMGTAEIFEILLILISAATSFPNPVDQVSTSRLKDTAGVTVEARSPFKFPNHSKPPYGQIVRSPQGSWSRDTFNSSRDTSSEAIMFPDEYYEKEVIGTRNEVPIFKPNIAKKATPECARGSTFCEKIDNYPRQYLEDILQTASKDFGAMFGNDTPPEIQQRIDSSDENPLCPSVEQVVYPKTAKNKENVWLFVVNQGQYTQGVRIEKCLNTDQSQSCKFTEGFPLGYKTYCKQKYIYRKLIALDENGKTVTDTFQLPSCCSCTVVAEGLNSRLGLPGRVASKPKTTTGKPSG